LLDADPTKSNEVARRVPGVKSVKNDMRLKFAGQPPTSVPRCHWTVRLASGEVVRAESASQCWFAEQTFQPTVEEMIMAVTPNKDQVKGELKDLGGKIQEEAGKLVGSKEQEAKGLKKQAEGKLQKTVGNLKEAVTDAIKKA
jgi:uncharacterized protein YjbJ (UPF0337 family)